MGKVTKNVVDAYQVLLARTRCRAPAELQAHQLQFHFFPSMFFEKLKSLAKYDFLHLSSFLDKHYHSCKSLTLYSMLIFHLDDFQLLLVDISSDTITYYDTYGERDMF